MSPFAALKPCKYPGCSELVKTGYCEKHQKETDQRWKEAAKGPVTSDEEREIHRLYDRKWKKRREFQLAQHPWCEDCLSVGIYTGATDVHHVIRHGGDRVLFISSPLISLCRACHSRRTLGEVQGVRENYYPQILQPISIPVYLVCGAPASGKTRFVDEHKKPDDLVFDLDMIIAELTGHQYRSPEHYSVIMEAIRTRNRRLEALPNVIDKGQAAWVIVGAPDPRDRWTWRTLLKPKMIYVILCTADECTRRIEHDNDRLLVAEDQKKAVVKWFEKYKPLSGEELIEWHA